jgi:hypothetical protein
MPPVHSFWGYVITFAILLVFYGLWRLFKSFMDETTREKGTLEKIRRLTGRLTSPQREAVLSFITELIEEEDREDYPASEK